MSEEYELGFAIPSSPHAVSVSLPRWRDVVGYEEGQPEVIDALQAGYPRFFFHPAVRRATEAARRELGLEEQCLVFPSMASANLAHEFVRERSPGAELVVHPWRAAFALAMSTEAFASAKLFWQHTGLGISSRHALVLLQETHAPATASSAKNTLRQRIADLTSVEPKDVWLFPTGMAAIHAALRALMSMRPRQPTAQLCFPYLDTLKLQRELVPEVFFYPGATDKDLTDLSSQAASSKLAGVFTEIPSNPLLQMIDSGKLADIAAQHDFPVVVDDSIGCFYNQDTLEIADMAVASLTKYFSGSGEVMAGALIVNPRSRYPLADEVASHYEDTLYGADAEALEIGSRDFEARMDRVNETTALLCKKLAAHPAVAEVYYGLTQPSAHYELLRKPRGGHGGLFSLLLEDAPNATPGFYDRLALAKGPSFGMRQTLACPYTLLAHYHELDWAEQHGVSRYLIRFSVGLEDPDELFRIIESALR